MYKLIKDKGIHKISVMSTDTKATIDIGVISTSILSILEEGEGLSVESGKLNLSDQWSFEISNETKEKLLELTMMMKKPDRKKHEQKQKTTSEEESKPREKKAPVDVFNLIYGIE